MKKSGAHCAAIGGLALAAFALLPGCGRKAPSVGANASESAEAFANRANELDAAAANDSAAAQAQAIREQAGATSSDAVASNRMVIPANGNSSSAH